MIKAMQKLWLLRGRVKTTTLAMFIKQRLRTGANPKRMLVIMYNKSAQLDFTAKLSSLMSSTDNVADGQPRHSGVLPQG